MLPDMISGAEVVYTDALKPHGSQSGLSRLLGRGAPSSEGSLQSLLKTKKVKALKPVMNQLRLTKSEAEVANMRKAGKLSGKVFTETMKKPYQLEKDMWTDLAYGFRSKGLDGEAYVPVVAGGTVS